jgi:hypothetical protein
MRIIAVIALSAAAALAAPALASASTYCVGNLGGACDVPKPATAGGLQQALGEAQNSGGPDLVRIGPGTYTGNFTYASLSEVDLQGSGSATVIQGIGSQPALSLNASGDGSVVSDLELHMASVPSPQTTVGLRLGSAVAKNVRVRNPADSSGLGIELQASGKVQGSTLLMGSATGMQDAGAGQHEVEDTFIAGAQGILAGGGTRSVERSHISAKYTGLSTRGTATLRNSIVRVSGATGQTSAALHREGPGVLTADHVTIQGGANATYGATATMTTPGTGSINMESSILSGTFSISSFARAANGGGVVNITVGHSNFAPPDQNWVGALAGPGIFQETPFGTNTNSDPKFVDPLFTLESPTVDLRLRHDSPLIDHGEPGGVQEKDLAGDLRLVNGDGVGDPVSDMGAYEYQRRAPTAVIAAPSAGAFATGAPVAFSAEGSGDPDAGDSLEYTWSFGDGATTGGASPSHAYDVGGQRTVTLTVTDPTGLTATATKELLVEAPLPGSGSGPGSGPGTEALDDIAPAISSVSLRGTRVRFRLSEAARVRFAIQRRSGGRRLGSFVRAASAGRNTVRFAGRLRLRGHAVSLAPGRYRLTLVATDPAGNRSAARRVRFRVVRR